MDTPIFLEHEDEEAFAKLEGRNLKHFIKKKIVILGREPGESTEQEQTIVIGNSLRISRRHIKIFWCDKDKEWKIQSLSKNKVYVNKNQIKREDAPQKLEDCAAIKFDTCMMYFFPAISEGNP